MVETVIAIAIVSEIAAVAEIAIEFATEAIVQRTRARLRPERRVDRAVVETATVFDTEATAIMTKIAIVIGRARRIDPETVRKLQIESVIVRVTAKNVKLSVVATLQTTVLQREVTESDVVVPRRSFGARKAQVAAVMDASSRQLPVPPVAHVAEEIVAVAAVATAEAVQQVTMISGGLRWRKKGRVVVVVVVMTVSGPLARRRMIGEARDLVSHRLRSDRCWIDLDRSFDDAAFLP